MKKTNLHLLGCALFLVTAFACESTLLAQASTTTTTTTTSAGTINEFGTDSFVIKTESDPAPLRYSYSKSTTYVDETGVPVSIETVKSGLPVTVYYIKEGDRLIANKVVVRKKSTVTKESPAVIEEKKTKTTTTEIK
ncbi:MAG: hypothetical protein V4710_16655 [Verrucomicrobiota bacterium]